MSSTSTITRKTTQCADRALGNVSSGVRNVFRPHEFVDKDLRDLTQVALRRQLGLIPPEAMAGKTVLVIAHRLPTILHLDRFLVFDKGQIVEDGDHRSLLEKRGHHYQL